jgi:hypothetical protein
MNGGEKEMKKAYEIIADQIGGARQVAMMTGCRILHDGENKLILNGLKCRAKYNSVTIEYDEGADLYNMRFIKFVSGKNPRIIREKKIDGVFCDQLIDIIEEETGLTIALKRPAWIMM